MHVLQARSEHIEEVARLFDQYRVFYNQSSDIEAAKNFLQERFRNDSSIIFVASQDNCLIGFIQLYPSFSSVSMRPIWILNDLFVEERFRNQGAANLLMAAAEELARKTGAVRIVLATQMSNFAAQALYQSRGYSKDEEFYHYSLSLS